MTKDASDTNKRETTSGDAYQLEELRQKYGLYKVVAGTLVVGVIAALLPFIIDYYKVSLDEETFRTEFIAKHVDVMQKSLPEERLAVVEYFSFVLPNKDQRDLWIAYRKRLKELKEEVEEKRLEEARLVAAGDAKDLTRIEQLRVEIEKKDRLLSWAAPSDLIVLQMATYQARNCEKAQREVDSYVAENAFARSPSLWLMPSKKYVVIGIQATTMPQAKEFLAEAVRLSNTPQFDQESLKESRVRINPNWRALRNCKDLLEDDR